MDLRLGENGEELVGGGLHHQGDPLGNQTILEGLGLSIGMSGQTEPQAVLKQGGELNPQQSALGQNASVLLHAGAEMPL